MTRSFSLASYWSFLKTSVKNIWSVSLWILLVSWTYFAPSQACYRQLYVWKTVSSLESTPSRTFAIGPSGSQLQNTCTLTSPREFIIYLNTILPWLLQQSSDSIHQGYWFSDLHRSPCPDLALPSPCPEYTHSVPVSLDVRLWQRVTLQCKQKIWHLVTNMKKCHCLLLPGNSSSNFPLPR